MTFFLDRPSAPRLDEPARLFAVPVKRGARDLVLVVGSTRENRLETLRSLRAAFLIGGAMTLVVSSLAAYLMAAAALRPVQAMTRRARGISSSSLDERLPVPPTSDEVAELGSTLNEMLTRIEDGVVREQRFVADAAHELRTPLALLRAELELALRRERTPEQLETAIRAATDETDRLRLITDDLLLLARSAQGRLPVRAEPTDIVDLLLRVAARFAPRARARARTITVDANGACVAQVDPLRVEQAVGNVLDNALRYGRGQIDLSSIVVGEMDEVHVRDRGPGFQRELARRAFDRFSRGDERRTGGGGAGLGLAIVETIAGAHGGNAGVASRPEGGADVWITLPIKPLTSNASSACPRDDAVTRPIEKRVFG